MSLTLNDFDYALPDERIAQAPLQERTQSRLLVLNPDQSLQDLHFDDLTKQLRPGDLLVLNDTRVIRARLYGTKATGGQVEVLIERLLGPDRALAQVRASKSPRAGTRLRLENAFDVEVIGRAGEFFELQLCADSNFEQLLQQHGKLPLPPYIDRAADEDDEQRYQTVFSRTPGSVAAPTAGLHFSTSLLQALETRGIELAWLTLHVGAGTFQPVRVNNLSEHVMHTEYYSLPQNTIARIQATQARGGRIIAVGTTSLRTLESAARQGELQPGSHHTDLFILPGYRFNVVDALITNFHLPKSTLLMLVSAFAGRQQIQQAYAHAIAQKYRFFSYGDAMFIAQRNDSHEI